MGVPKFYRWISERYPCLSQVVKDYQIPEFDNFYLDMNGIIHNCSHPNDDDPSFRISEEKIFSEIFHYLEVLFRIIKPQKLLLMAIDGVAPRAKMNQQRGRRFRSAKDAEDLMRKAVARGVKLPEEARFDSNCITPGTEFMARLQDHLKYFINQKISTDPAWQKIEVILSGHQVPGEGEHKIMEYIRWMKAQKDYNPNTRHCLYGLDADLIMLGLTTHEPHFSLLREEVVFGKKAKRQTTPDTITFHLLHLSILREYLDYEFSSLKDLLPFDYDLERIIDDWILMGFLVGNDFIPHLPNMLIRQDVLPFLYQRYIAVLPTLEGYINANGVLNMERFEKYLQSVAEFDYDHFSELISDVKWMAGKSDVRRRKKKTDVGNTEKHSELDVTEDSMDESISFMDFNASFSSGGNTSDLQAEEKLKRDLGISSLEKYFADEDEDRVENFEEEMMRYKARYYCEKMGFETVDSTVLHEQAKCYVVGIQWILHYYYTGVCSWSWFYPYHYAPYVSDIKDIGRLEITFELGKPFLPFEQLMAVLPSASRFLLPTCYQGLMVNEDSPIIDFYPCVFSTDLNGKQHEWEAVVLVPFIDEERLIGTLKEYSSLLSKEEVKRNCHASCLSYTYQKTAHLVNYASPWKNKFPDIQNCKAVCKSIPANAFVLPKEKLTFGLCQGVKTDVYYPGFPTLKHVPHKASLKQLNVRVFQAVSRGWSMCLEVLPRVEQDKPMAVIAKELMGKICYVGWPYLVEAKVWAVATSRESWYANTGTGQQRIVKDRVNEEQSKRWKEDVTSISREYTQRHGIVLGEVKVLVYAQGLQGKRFVMDKSSPRGTLFLEKQWSQVPAPYPLQTTVVDIASHAPEFKDKIKTMEELYSVGDKCFLLAPEHYGEQAEIVSVDTRIQRVIVRVCPQQEPNLNPLLAKYHNLSVNYQPLFRVASRLKLPPILLSRVTASFQCERGSKENTKERERFNLGLSWKFSQRNQELLGYARRTEGGWSFSPNAETLLKQYMERFPKMFSYLIRHPDQDRYYEDELFPEKESDETLVEAKEWLKSLPTQDMVPVDCGSDTVDEVHICELEKAIANMKANPKQPKPMKMRIKPGALFKVIDEQRGLLPDESAEYYLLDRVVNVGSSSCVPFGLRGTVTGILGDTVHPLYEVVFDEEFLGGLALRCSGNKAYHLPPHCLINLSHGERLNRVRHNSRYSQRSSALQDPKHSPRFQTTYSPENRDTVQQLPRQVQQSPRQVQQSPRQVQQSPRQVQQSPRQATPARREDHNHKNQSLGNKYGPKGTERTDASYSSQRSPLRHNTTQTPTRKKPVQYETRHTDTNQIKAIVTREQKKVGTAPPSSAASEFVSMMEGYHHHKDKHSFPSMGEKKSSAEENLKSDISGQVTASSINTSNAIITTKTQSSEGGPVSTSEKGFAHQSPTAGSVPSTTNAGAPMAAAIQALAKLDISTLPTKSAVQSPSQMSKETTVEEVPNQEKSSSAVSPHPHESALPSSRNQKGDVITTSSSSSAGESSLAPSVAAVFASVDKSRHSTSAHDTDVKSGPSKTPLLDHPQFHSPLLPSPPVPVQGLHKPPFSSSRSEFTPKDFIAELNILSRSLQLPPPHFHETIVKGEATSFVSVGQFTYSGAKCRSVEEARQSAAALALSKIAAHAKAVHQYYPYGSPPWLTSYYPMPYSSMSPGTQPSFPSPLRFTPPKSAYYHRSPRTPSPSHPLSPFQNQFPPFFNPLGYSPNQLMPSPVGLGVTHPRGPKPPLSASATAFVPMQVQKRQANKAYESPNNSPAAQDPSVVAPIRTNSPPTSKGLSNQEVYLMSRLETATTNFEEIRAKADKVEHMLAKIPKVEAIHAPVHQFRGSSTGEQVGTATILVPSDSDGITLIEPVAPTDRTESDTHSICIAGDIIMTEEKCRN